MNPIVRVCTSALAAAVVASLAVPSALAEEAGVAAKAKDDLSAIEGAFQDAKSAIEGPMTNQDAANGPIPGDVTLYAGELACQQAIPTPGYYSSLNGAEISDAQRSGMFPCATFTGSWDGPNAVYAFRSEDDYPGFPTAMGKGLYVLQPMPAPTAEKAASQARD
jgi:hypothetical protein